MAVLSLWSGSFMTSDSSIKDGSKFAEEEIGKGGSSSRTMCLKHDS